MKSQTVIRAFLASPGDASAERDAITEVVDELNLTWADFLGTRLDLTKWESHALPAAGPDPQSAINQQLIDDIEYEIFMGVLKSRLGTPTARAASGTVEEFERAYARYSALGSPEIMIYLHVDAEHDAATASFKERLIDLGVFFWQYGSDRHFERTCRIHLSRQVQRVARRDSIRPKMERIFPDASKRDITAVCQAAADLARESVSLHRLSKDRFESLGDSSGRMARNFRAVKSKVSRLLRPGFRRPKGGASKIVGDFVRQLDRYAEEIVAEDVMTPCLNSLDAYIRLISIVAPLAPLPTLLRDSLEGASGSMINYGRTLTAVRSTTAETRYAFADYKFVETEEFRDARRKTLEALDTLDREMTEAVHLAREIEWLTDEILRGHDS